MAENKPAILCICGTDTDAGKTVATAALLRAATERGLAAGAIKPVQTGCRPAPGGADGKLCAPDVAVYERAAPGAPAVALYLFEEACSPHLAAARNEVSLSARDIAAEIRRAASSFDLALVEGAGGLLVPLNAAECLADVFAELAVGAGAPALLVVGNKLGAVNHALLTLEALRARGIEPLGFVLVNRRPAAAEGGLAESGVEQAILRDNPEIIAKQGRLPCLAELPYCPEINAPEGAATEAGWRKLAGLLKPVLDSFTAWQSKRLDNSAAELLDFDRDHLWHPYTSALRPLKTWQAAASRGEHLYLRDREGREFRVTDGMSSWWAAIHGYNHPRLLEALRAQAARLPHVMFGGITHEPAARLGRKLLELAPDGLEYVFLSDSGSVSVEVALKMALQYQVAAGRPEKSRLLTVRGGYHGDTLGCMSVCDPVNGMHRLFEAVLPKQLFAPRPECRWDQPYDPASLDGVREIFRKESNGIAALIIEPVVQGAGGMWFYRPEYLAGLRKLCDENGCLLILDEVATGFGRTGRMFACEWAGVSPDIMCVGKGLSGGVMSLAATLASGEVARGLSRDGGVLMHGPTFMGNPLACAVALASLELLRESPWRERVERIEKTLSDGLAPCRALAGVADVRVLGAIGVVEMKKAVPVEKVQDFFVRECGVWLRPFGNLIYLMPPYIIDDAGLRLLCRAVCQAAARLSETDKDGEWE